MYIIAGIEYLRSVMAQKYSRCWEGREGKFCGTFRKKKTGKGRVQVLISYMLKSPRPVFTGKGVLPLDNHDYFSYLDHIAFIYTNICVREAFLEIYYNDETQEKSLTLLLTGRVQKSPPPPVFRVPLPNVWR